MRWRVGGQAGYLDRAVEKAGQERHGPDSRTSGRGLAAWIHVLIGLDW
jgi:hypothetical protein